MSSKLCQVLTFLSLEKYLQSHFSTNSVSPKPMDLRKASNVDASRRFKGSLPWEISSVPFFRQIQFSEARGSKRLTPTLQKGLKFLSLEKYLQSHFFDKFRFSEACGSQFFHLRNIFSPIFQKIQFFRNPWIWEKRPTSTLQEGLKVLSLEKYLQSHFFRQILFFWSPWISVLSLEKYLQSHFSTNSVFPKPVDQSVKRRRFKKV